MNKTVVILGAGATRGASFVDPSANPCLPFLDGDFFTQLQRVTNPKHRALVKDVIRDAFELFGANFNVTLETMFTTIEHTIRMLETTGENRDFKRDELKQKRERLMQAIAATLEEALMRQASGRATLEPVPCEHTELLVKKLHIGDEIITFNYDCLIDYALKRFGSRKWNARYGYSVPLGSRGSQLTGHMPWMPTTPATEKTTMHLYKLHGSLHFHLVGKLLKLKQRPYTKQHGGLKFTIIPPESQKTYNISLFATLWRNAASSIHKADNLVFIGYSIPVTDMHSTALFRVHVKKAALKALVVVNPNKEARFRTREVLSRGLSPETRVYSFDTFEEFVKMKRSLWDRK